MAQKNLTDMINQVSFAVSDDESKFAMNGALFEKDGNSIVMVGTDGRRLSYINRQMINQIPDFGSVTIPSRFLSIIKKGEFKNWAEAIMGFGMLFLGLSGLSDVFTPDQLGWLFKIQGSGVGAILLGFLIGIIITALLHSSSAFSAIVITMAFNGLISWELAAAMTLGSNVGSTIDAILDAIKNAKRPVFHAGYGIRLSGAYETFRKVMEKLNIPVVTYWNAVDLIEDEHPLYTGRAGNMGDRAGNWAIQNADLILAVGTRISIRQVGYNWKTWAREAKVIMVDIDRAEMKKPTIHVDMPVWADAADFLKKVDAKVEDGAKVFADDKWPETTRSWRDNYPVVQPRQWEENGETANVYAFMQYMSSQLPEGSLTAVSNGACCVVGNQAYVIKKGSRMTNNSAIASMGYGLPAALGTCIAGKGKETICLEGDGSIMMNLQELQTIITLNLPIKIFLINNNGYHSIRITQNNLFKDHCKIGIGPESQDLSFPDFEKLSKAFGYPYYCAHSNEEMKKAVDATLAHEGPVFCEIFTDTKQVWEPKSATKRLADGTLVSPPLEDLAPFLPREELKKIMIVPMMDEE